MALSWTGKAVIVAVASTISLAASSTSAYAGGEDGDYSSSVTGNDGAEVGLLTEGFLKGLTGNYFQSITKPPKPPYYKYATTSYCNSKPPGTMDSDLSCSQSVAKCNSGDSNPIDPLGPAANVWRMRVDAKGSPITKDLRPDPAQEWEYLGYTCNEDAVPGVTNVLTMRDLVAQFRKTKFAKAGSSIQPVGNTTLVNLKTFFETEWPETGFQPDEIDTATLMGRSVRIKPTLKSINYLFGDGSESGPTQSLGGPYPNGDIVHTYRQAQEVTVRVDVIYGGQFSVDGSEWIDIPGEATVEGTPQTLRVAEAKARLYNN